MSIQIGYGVSAYQYTGNITSLASSRGGKTTLEDLTGGDGSATGGDQITLSDAAKQLMAGASASSSPSAQEIQKNLDAIKAKPAVERTTADNAYLSKYDTQYNALQEKMQGKGSDALTADDLSYMQKASGMINTMAYLSPQEKSLYDSFIAQGNTEAAHGLALVALSRVGMSGQQVTLSDGQSFDPTKTELTSENVRNLFKQMFVGSNGESDKAFDALASALNQQSGTNGSSSA